MALLAFMLAAGCSGDSGGGPQTVAQCMPALRCGQRNYANRETSSARRGVLKVALAYETTVDQSGNTLFCYMTADGNQAPTLHINPGDHLVLNLINATPAKAAMSDMQMDTSAVAASVCGAATMTGSSTNVHFHGTNTPPICHQDEVIHTLVNSGETFTYDVAFPSDEPSGLYWYHPHVHGLSEAAVQGGASGAIVIEGIEKIQPAVAGLPEQLLIVRDNPVPGAPEGPTVPAWDVSLNYIPIPYPKYPPAIINIGAGERQFWRVLNASADTILDLQLQYDGVAQPLEVVALDGVPTGSQNGTSKGVIVTETAILLSPAARAEFIVTGPSKTVKNATLLTLNVDTGPDGDIDPQRPLARVQTAGGAATKSGLTMPAVSGPPNPQRFAGLAQAVPALTRTLFFSEAPNPKDPEGEPNFFITVEGQTPEVFNPNNPPAIVTTQGSTEDWTIWPSHCRRVPPAPRSMASLSGALTLPVPRQQEQEQSNPPAGSGLPIGTCPTPLHSPQTSVCASASVRS